MKNCTPLWREAHSKPRVSRTEGLGPLFEVEMLKKCTALWREAHFEVKSVKAEGLGALLEVEMSKKYEKVDAVVARSTFGSQKC